MANHSALQGAFGEFFNRFTLARKLACAFPELRATFAGRSYVPDVAVYRWDRIPRDETGQVEDDFFDPPDLAVEIVSPQQSVTALVRKCLWYVDNGVQIALLVDPGDESVLLLRSGRRAEALRGTDQIDLADLLPGFTLTVRDLYDSLGLKASR